MMNKVKKFFCNLGSWIKKAFKVCVNFFKENVWASVLGIVIAILLFILLVQGIVKGIDKLTSNEQESGVALKATTITSKELMNKIDNGDTFVLFIGANSCAHCKSFYKTINTYVKSGNTVYYIDVEDTSDPTLAKNRPEILEKMLNELPTDREITTLSTPTTIYVENGIFMDALQGAYGMQGGSDYATFCDIVEGNYVGKPKYTFKGA